MINASAKIFPITEDMITNNLNPNGYEYGKVGKRIYIWINGKWDYIVADDTNISFTELKDVPTEFKPMAHKHLMEEITDLDVYNKTEVDTKLLGKSNTDHTHPYSPSDHNHDLAYARIIVETVVADLQQRLFNIENGYTEGHSHPNVDIVNSITQAMLDAWNTVTQKADKAYVDLELSKKAPTGTVQGHIDNTTVHVTQTDKDKLNEVYGSGFGRYVSSITSVDADTATLSGIYYLASSAPNKPAGITDCALLVIAYSDIWVNQLALDWRTNKQYSRVCSNGVWSAGQLIGGTGVSIGTVKPTDGSMWYKVIG